MGWWYRHFGHGVISEIPDGSDSGATSDADHSGFYLHVYNNSSTLNKPLTSISGVVL